MGRLRSAKPPRRERFNEPSPASGSGRPFRRGRSRVAEPSSLPLRIWTRDVLPMNGLSKGSMPTPERDGPHGEPFGVPERGRGHGRSQSAPGDVGVEGYAKRKDGQPCPDIAEGQRFRGVQRLHRQIGDFQRGREERHLRAAHATCTPGRRHPPLAQADHAELAHVQHAEEQAVQQQAKQEIEPPPYQRGPGRRGRKREKQPVQQRPHHVTAPYGKRVSLRASCGGVAARR